MVVSSFDKNIIPQLPKVLADLFSHGIIIVSGLGGVPLAQHGTRPSRTVPALRLFLHGGLRMSFSNISFDN